jgi:hypothetical protein
MWPRPAMKLHWFQCWQNWLSSLWWSSSDGGVFRGRALTASSNVIFTVLRQNVDRPNVDRPNVDRPNVDRRMSTAQMSTARMSTARMSTARMSTARMSTARMLTTRMLNVIKVSEYQPLECRTAQKLTAEFYTINPPCDFIVPTCPSNLTKPGGISSFSHHLLSGPGL